LYFTPAGSGIGFFPMRDILQNPSWLASPEKQLPLIICNRRRSTAAGRAESPAAFGNQLSVIIFFLFQALMAARTN